MCAVHICNTNSDDIFDYSQSDSLCALYQRYNSIKMLILKIQFRQKPEFNFLLLETFPPSDLNLSIIQISLKKLYLCRQLENVFSFHRQTLMLIKKYLRNG